MGGFICVILRGRKRHIIAGVVRLCLEFCPREQRLLARCKTHCPSYQSLRIPLDLTGSAGGLGMSTDNLLPWMAPCDLRCVPCTGCSIAQGTQSESGDVSAQADGQTDKGRTYHSHPIELFPETRTRTHTVLGGFSSKFRRLWLKEKILISM